MILKAGKLTLLRSAATTAAWSGVAYIDSVGRGVSTRAYQEVLPEMAATVGVSRSSVSRQAIEASAEQLKELQERRWEGIEILAITSTGSDSPRITS